ncbi:succinate dehydrogenase, cytochrome b556 subunit [Terricaulis sp.]|uniref:succinate dehydrogenase, cytochrome b556 subunit n=1 Tax=Terricaulis sp. TaxID=2768686 RepID=UPI0037831BBC
MAGVSRPEDRPLSPHLSIWRWHVTMASSILHRFSGIGLYAGGVCFALWLIALAMGPETYRLFGEVLAAWYGQVALYLIVAALAYHGANGLRHLMFDTGSGLVPKNANRSAWFCIFIGFATPIALWAALNLGGVQ